MALVRDIITDALVELSIVRPGATVDAPLMATGLSRIQGMIDAWAANRQTLARQLRTSFTMPDGDNEITVGSGQAVDIVTPMWINSINYLNPGSTPSVEVPIGQMDEDAFAALLHQGIVLGVAVAVVLSAQLGERLRDAVSVAGSLAGRHDRHLHAAGHRSARYTRHGADWPSWLCRRLHVWLGRTADDASWRLG
jgi:hypothetical protein